MRRLRLAISLFGTPEGFAGRVSGLQVYQQRLQALLRARDVEIVPIYFLAKRDRRRPEVRFDGAGHALLDVGREPLVYRMESESREFGLHHPGPASVAAEALAQFLRAQGVDAFHIVEWLSAGMVVWEAALRWGGTTTFTPTEHGSICPRGFLLQPRGTACADSAGGSLCGACVAGLAPSPKPIPDHPWASRRYEAIDRAAGFLPRSVRTPFSRAAARLAVESPLTPAEGHARMASTRRFLTTISAVNYQSNHQHAVFERFTQSSLPAKLPAVVPIDLKLARGRPNPKAEGPVRFVFAARPDFDRGLWLLVEAWKMWAPSAEQATLTIATHAPLPAIKRKVDELGGSVQTEIGTLNAQSRKRLLFESDFVVNPAVWEEPGSATVLEGLCHGVPAIVPVLTGSAELIRDGENGYLYPFRDPAGLAATFERAIKARTKWEEMSEKAYLAAQRYLASCEEHMSEWIRLLGRSLESVPGVK